MFSEQALLPASFFFFLASSGSSCLGGGSAGLGAPISARRRSRLRLNDGCLSGPDGVSSTPGMRAKRGR